MRRPPSVWRVPDKPLVPAMNLGLVRPDAVVSLNHVPSLDAVFADGECLRLGALVSHRRIEKEGGLQWPVPTPDSPSTEYLHKGGVLRGKGLFQPVEFRPSGGIPNSLPFRPARQRRLTSRRPPLLRR